MTTFLSDGSVMMPGTQSEKPGGSNPKRGSDGHLSGVDNPFPEMPTAEILTRVEGSRRLEFWEKNPPGSGFVYLIQGEHRTPVKVGYAKDPRKRLGQLQTGSYVELHILDLLPGAPDLERYLHRHLAAHGVRGEWFKWNEAVTTWLAFRAVAEAAMTFFQATGRVPNLEVFDAWHDLIGGK